MDAATKTDRSERSATVAFRLSEEQKHLIFAVAARGGGLPSDWLRQTILAALQQEFATPQLRSRNQASEHVTA